MSILKLCGIENQRKCIVEIDYYIPFEVKVVESSGSHKENIAYWRTGDIERSLIEIGIGLNTGILRSITLVAFKTAFINNYYLEHKEIEEGTPVFDVNIIPQNGIYDYISDFQIYLGDKDITVVINESNKCEKIIRLDRLDIGVDKENFMTHISINNINSDEYSELRDALKL